MEVIELLFALTVAGRHQNKASVDRESLQFNVKTAVISVCPSDSDGGPGRLLSFVALANGVGDEGGLVAHGSDLSVFVPHPMHGIADSFSGGHEAAVQSRPLASRSGAELHKPVGRGSERA